MNARLRRTNAMLVGASMCAACTAHAPVPPQSVAASVPPPAQPWPTVSKQPRLRAPTVHQAVLANGFRVLGIEAPGAETVQMSFVSRTAADKGKPGLAFLTALVMRLGASGAADSAGSDRGLADSTSSNVTSSGTWFALTTLPSEAALGVATLGRIAQRPSFDRSTVQRARALAAVYAANETDNLFGELQRTAAASLFGPDNTEARLVPGSDEQRGRIADADLKRFYSALCTPTESALLLVGALSWEATLALAKQTFESWRPERQAHTSPSQPWELVARDQRPRAIGIAADDDNASMIAALACPARNSSDTVAADLTASLLGDISTGVVGRLRNDLSSSYFVSASCNQTRNGGMFEFLLDSDPERLGYALATIKTKLDALAGWPPDLYELERARATYLSRYAQNFASNAGLLNLLWDQFVNELPDDYFVTLEAKVVAVTPRDIQSYAQRYLDLRDMVVVVEGSPRQLNAPLTRLGEVRWLNIGD